MMEPVKSLLHKEPIWGALLVLSVSLLCYLPNLSGFGFYQDDWYLLWSAAARGPASIIDLFAMDRPFMGLVNYVDYLFLGDNLHFWQGYALFWRAANSLMIFWLLRLVWPQQRLATTTAALLVTIYPAYLVQPVVMNFKNYIFEYTLAIVSMILTVYALKSVELRKKLILTGLGLFFTLFYILLYEFMIGLEATRFALIITLIWPDQNWMGKFKSTLVRGLKIYLPYAAVTLGFVIWRFFIFESSRPSVSEAVVLGKFLQSPMLAGRNALIELGKDLIETLLLSWGVPFYRFAVDAPYRYLAGGLLVAGIGAILVLGYLLWFKSELTTGLDAGMRAFFIVGGVSLIASLFTIVIPGRNVLLGHDFGRYSLHATLGVALLVSGFISISKREQQVGILTVMVSLSICTHFLNGIDHMQGWEKFKDTWWQVFWRAPNLREDTLIMFSGAYGPQQDYEIWGPANLIYYPGRESPVLDAEILYNESANLLIRGVETPDHLRDITLSKDYSKALIFSRPSANSCLHALDGSFPITPSGENPYVRLSASYSDIDRIVPNSPYPAIPAHIFGAEPERSWCYYYQRAALARQKGDWAEVVRLGNEAQDLGYAAADPSEWMVFLEANQIMGRTNQTRWMSKIIWTDRFLANSICQNMEESPPTLPGYDLQGIYGILCDK